MEEELSENELEERMYGMLHFVDENGGNVSTNPKPANDFVDNGHRSTIKRYWRTSSDNNSIYQKVNIPNESVTNKDVIINQPKAKDEKIQPTNPSVDLSIFQQPVSQNVQKTVEILENDEDNRVVELESSDEDEVVEVALPPKPTITIESSDEEDVCTVTIDSPAKIESKPTQEKVSGDREVTASPVPSVVSSVSDEFIRGDCIALNISSRHTNNQSFDFSLHDADLLDQTPKKKKKKRNKDATSTPITTPASNTSATNLEECFATPKSKAKNKRQRTKSYKVSEKSIPNPDVYDSDSNQSMNENTKTQSPYIVTDKSLPCTDVYESDSNQSENNKETRPLEVAVTKDINSSDKAPLNISISETPKSNTKSVNETVENTVVVDLTDTENTTIDENIVMANVTGFSIDNDFNDDSLTPLGDISKCGSTKIPDILSADLDFDNLKGNAKTCKSRRYSLTTLRAEMDKFYNESWGGEEFNHREIQKNMSRDKNLWVIDAKDRMSSLSRRKATCNYCNRPGHRDETCRMKPAICFMCGSTGHFEPRCPKKICVNCGSPNHMYSTMCRNCCNWNYIKCAECGQNGHPASHCPDIWRRYHNTVNLDTPLEESLPSKKHYQMFCSGCTRRGHLVHTCRITLPFSGLPVNSPYVAVYRPVYQIQRNHCSQNHDPNIQNQNCKNKTANQYQQNAICSVNQTLTPRHEHLKRQSKSPITHDSLNKKRNLGISNDCEMPQRTKSPLNTNSQRKNSQSRDQTVIPPKDGPEPNKNTRKSTEDKEPSKAPDFIPITSDNRDKRGQMIQDNEVSDTSEVITSARIYVTKEVINKIKTDEGQLWLNETIKNNNITLETPEITFFLSIKGTVGNQEAFQSELKEWIKTYQRSKERLISENTDGESTLDTTNDNNPMSRNIPKNRNNVLRKISKALESLKKDLGDPKAMYKELVYLQNRHQQLLNQKVISPNQLGNNKENINGMLRKLNMVLLGQAGLADGPKHVSELYSLQEKLTNFRQKNISPSLREEIGEHYHCIFTAIPRDDYIELLSKYYNKQTPQFKRKKYDKTFKVSPNPNQQKHFNAIQNVKKNFNIEREDTNNVENEFSNEKSFPIKKTKNKLVFYHRRLLNSQTNDNVLKKLRNKLVRKLHTNIALLGNMNQMSSRDLRNMRKIQEQAQIFLANV